MGPHDKVVGADTVRFIGRSELMQCLNEAGFVRQIWYGDWDRSPVEAQSPELIVLAQLR